MNENKTPTTESLERPHHPFSPSKLQYLQSCACYSGRDVTSKAAETGTLQHHATETGEDIASLGDAEMDAVAECIDFVENMKTVLESQRLEEVERSAKWRFDRTATPNTANLAWECACEEADKATPPVLELMEDYLPIDDLTYSYLPLGASRAETFYATTAGYLDRALVSWDRLHAVLVDFKFGRWPVTRASENLQGIAYALGLRKKFPTLKTVKVYFKLPHQQALDCHTFDLEKDGDRLYLQIRCVVERAVAATFNPNDFSGATPVVPTCLFCARLGRCDAVAKVMLGLCHKFAPLKVPDDITPSRLRKPDEAGTAMRCAQVAKAWGDALRQTTSNAVISGSMEMPPGYRIEQREGNRRVVNMQLFELVAKDFQVPTSVIESAKSITMGPIEEAVKESAPRGEKTDTLKRFRAAADKSGALERGDSYSFLKAIPVKDPK